MLTCSCLGYDALLAHPFGQEDLSDGIVYLVSARMIQVFPLQIEAAAVPFAHASGIVERAGTAHIVAKQAVVFAEKLLAVNDLLVLLLQCLERPIEDFGHVGTAVLAVETVLVNVIIHIHYILIYVSGVKEWS